MSKIGDFLSIDEFKQKFRKEESLKDIEDLKLRKSYTVQKGEIVEEKGSLIVPFIISTAARDRDNDIIAMDGWDLKNYNENPVVLWAHRYGEPPVGKALNTRIDADSLKSEAKFTPKDLNPFGYMIGQMYKEGYLNAVSVGFNPTEYKWAEDEDRPWGIDYAKQELLEYSAVPVPANPDALTDAKSKGIDLAPMMEWVVRSLDGMNYIPRESAEKIYSLMNTKSTFIIPKIGGKDKDGPEKGGLVLFEKQIQINNNFMEVR